jgi:GNAT superfamily N-acetyltransferase
LQIQKKVSPRRCALEVERHHVSKEPEPMSHDRADLPGEDTLVASWRALARLSPDARVTRSTGTVVAVFPRWSALNNAILQGRHRGGALTAVVSDLARTYAAADVREWALWIPSGATDLAGADAVREIDGLKRDTTTLVMELQLPSGLRRDDRVRRTSVAAATRATDEPVAAAQLPAPDQPPGLDAWVLVHDGMAVAGAWSCRHKTDCGVYAVGTVTEWRSRGLARALMEHILADARRRGARTATLQSTAMGQRLYRSLAFMPVGRYEEWVAR